MKKILSAVILFIFCTLPILLSAQDKPASSTIYFYRTKGFFGGGCSFRVKVGNQDFFNINNGGSAEFKIYSTGRVNIACVMSCNGSGSDLSLNVESGKNYFVSISAERMNKYLAAEEESSFKKHYSAENAMSYEEDIRMPINSSATENANKNAHGQGTCFLIAPGYLITNNHCIQGAKDISVKGIDGDFTTRYGATVVATDPSNDLALIKLGNKNLKFDALPSQLRTTGVAQGERVYALGFPAANAMGSEVKITDGIISAKSGAQGDISKYQISAAVNPGNSGGPLIDEEGNIIGVIYAKSTVAENAGYAVKASYLDIFLKNIDGFELPGLTNTIKDKPLTEKVAEWKRFIYIVDAE